MIHQLNTAFAVYEAGAGNRAQWNEAAPGNTRLLPQFLIGLDALRRAGTKYISAPKMAYRRIAPTTNARTAIATGLSGYGAGDSVFYYVANGSTDPTDFLSACISSLSFDFQMRNRLAGANLSQFVMNDTAVPSPARCAPYVDRIARFAFRLRARGIASAREWLQFGFDESRPWQNWWAVTRHERLRLRCILDAAVAALYDLTEEDFRWILRDCDHPVTRSTDEAFTRTLDPKGFWRVDKEAPPELRHPVISLVAFRALHAAGGLDAFLDLNDGDGWCLPDTITLADHGLGQGDLRAAAGQPLATSPALNPRYRADQLDLDAAASWAECRRHADILERLWNLPLGGGPAGDAGRPDAPVPDDGGEPTHGGNVPVHAATPTSGQASLFPDRVPPPTAQISLFGPK